MQVCTLLQTDNHASTSPLSFFTGRMPFLPPNQQHQSTESKKRVIHLSSIHLERSDCNYCISSEKLQQETALTGQPVDATDRSLVVQTWVHSYTPSVCAVRPVSNHRRIYLRPQYPPLPRCPSWFLQHTTISWLHLLPSYWTTANTLHLFNGLFSRTTWVSWYQKGKTSLDLNEARDDGVLGCSGISWTIYNLYLAPDR